jgi:predicted O-methyltransferase YrrM
MPLSLEVAATLADLHGLIPEAVGIRLAELAATVHPDHAIVEIGSYCGKSTCYLAHGSLAGKGAPVFAVDPWDTPGNVGGRFGYDTVATKLRFRQQVRDAGVAHQVTAFRAFSRDMARLWQRPIGLLYIDGSHTEEDVRTDLTLWSPYLVHGGIVAFDDYRTERNPGVAKVVDPLRQAGHWRWEDGPPPLVVGFLP